MFRPALFPTLLLAVLALSACAPAAPWYADLGQGIERAVVRLTDTRCAVVLAVPQSSWYEGECTASSSRTEAGIEGAVAVLSPECGELSIEIRPRGSRCVGGCGQDLPVTCPVRGQLPFAPWTVIDARHRTQ